MAEPIPTVAEVLDGVAAGTYTPAQGAVWIAAHIDDAVAQAVRRDDFAAMAMQMLMSDGKLAREAMNSGKSPTEAVALASFDMADAMVKASAR